MIKMSMRIKTGMCVGMKRWMWVRLGMGLRIGIGIRIRI
jgi:hypothetical protein